MHGAPEPLDEEALAELREDLGAAFPQFVAGFLESAGAATSELRGDLERDDLTGAASRAHSLKGTAGYLGATQLVAILAALQAACQAGDAHGARALIVDMAAAIAAIAPRLRATADGS